jgi:2-hydroxy-6-oxonona-2,4-dienedioate hydrolase
MVLDRHIERLEAKLAYLDRLDGPRTDLSYQNIATVKEEVDDAMGLRRKLERLRQMGVTRYSTSQRFTNVNGYIIRYLDYGPPDSNKIVILLHGLGASAERWSRVIPTLSRYHRVIIPDIIGFGYSDKPSNVEYTIDFFINDFLIPFLDSLGILKASIIGSSFGGHIATELAIRFNDRVEKLVLVSPAGMMKKESNPTLDSYFTAAMYPWYDLVYKAFSEMAYNSAIVSEETVLDFMNRMRLTNAKYAFHYTLLGMRYAPDLQGRLSTIIAPTLLVWGKNDSMIPLKHARAYDEIPNMERVLIENCGHTPYVENPNKFNKIVLKCLRGSSR